MGAIKTIRDKWEYRKAKWRFQSRKVTRARMLYWYFIFSGISMLIYGVSTIWTNYPFIFILAPVALLVSYFVLLSVYRNWKLTWLYIQDKDQGKLLLYLNSNTNFSDVHKRKLVQWVYLRRNRVRKEKWLELGEKIRTGKELTLEEKVLYRKKVIACPQQVLDGVNRAILINSLIYSHVQIHVLDSNLREILDLTNENMNKFDLQREINRCKVVEDREKADKYIKAGKKIIKNRKK